MRSLAGAGWGPYFSYKSPVRGRAASSGRPISPVGVMVMKHSIEELKAEIHQMYPDIDKYGVTSTLTFDKGKKTYVLELKKGVHHLSTYIDKADADKCMENIECIHLGVQIGQFLENFKKV
jgi:hypothetical protein